MMKLKIFGVLILLNPALSIAQEASDSKIAVSAIEKIAEEWKRIGNSDVSWLSACAENSWRLDKLENATVSYDLRKTDSLISPFLGEIKIRGVLKTNSRSPNANGFFSKYALPPRNVCFKTTAEAESAISPSDWNDSFDAGFVEMIAYYKFNDGRLVLSSGDKFFTNAMLKNVFLTGNAKELEKILSSAPH